MVNVLRVFSQGEEWRDEVRVWGRGNVAGKCLTSNTSLVEALDHPWSGQAGKS